MQIACMRTQSIGYTQSFAPTIIKIENDFLQFNSRSETGIEKSVTLFALVCESCNIPSWLASGLLGKKNVKLNQNIWKLHKNWETISEERWRVTSSWTAV